MLPSLYICNCFKKAVVPGVSLKPDHTIPDRFLARLYHWVIPDHNIEIKLLILEVTGRNIKNVKISKSNSKLP
jgi:hypothetical protein